MDTQKQENGTEDMRYGRWLRFTVGAVLAMLVMLGGLVVWVDPFFHYPMQDSVPGPVEVIQLSQKFLIVIVFSHQGISFMKTSYPPPES